MSVITYSLIPLLRRIFSRQFWLTIVDVIDADVHITDAIFSVRD